MQLTWGEFESTGDITIGSNYHILLEEAGMYLLKLFFKLLKNFWALGCT